MRSGTARLHEPLHFADTIVLSDSHVWPTNRVSHDIRLVDHLNQRNVVLPICPFSPPTSLVYPYRAGLHYATIGTSVVRLALGYSVPHQ